MPFGASPEFFSIETYKGFDDNLMQVVGISTTQLKITSGLQAQILEQGCTLHASSSRHNLHDNLMQVLYHVCLYSVYCFFNYQLLVLL